MVIIVVLAALTLLFFVVRKHIGPAHLASIAGLSVYEMFGTQFVDWLSGVASGAPNELLQHIIYLVLVAGFPILLYLRSARGGLHGILRVAESVIFAILLTALVAEPLAYFLPFDELATKISDFIKNIEGPIVLVGIIAAYIDILFLHSPKR